jgi:putative membrane protein
MKFLIRWLITAIAVAAAIALLPGFDVEGNPWVAIAIVSLIVGLVNATIGLVLKIGAIGCILMTFGLFTLVINAGLLWLSIWIVDNWLAWLGGTVTVSGGFWSYFWGALVISIVSGVLNWFVRTDDE